MYQGVGVVLSRYRSGKLPKAFKLVPKMLNWEQILFLTSKVKPLPLRSSRFIKLCSFFFLASVALVIIPSQYYSFPLEVMISGISS